MKLIIVLALGFLCTNHALPEETKKIGDEIVAENVTESKIQSCYVVNNKTGLADLNIDCFHMICDELNLSDLLSLAESEQAHPSAIETVIKRRFSQKRIMVSISSGPRIHGGVFKFEIIEKNSDKQRIYIEDSIKFEFVEILKKFLHLILFFEIHVDPSVSTANFSIIMEQVNKHCSESLILLDIARYDGDVINGDNMLENIQKPFKNVEYLLIRCTAFDYLHNSNLSFSEMFPAIRYVNFDHFRTQNGVWINQTCPHLEYLEAGEIVQESVDSFRELIQNNPQIEDLSLDMSNVADGLKLLHSIAQNLPNLDSLKINGYGSYTDNSGVIEIHFEGLKELILSGYGTSLPQNTTFGQLEKLETARDYEGNSDRWMKLVKNQKSLKKLTVKQIMKDSDILEIANTESNVAELAFKCECKSERHKYSRFNIGYETAPSCSCNAKVESIILMIRNSNQLQKLVLYSGWAATDSVFEALQKQLPSEWKISKGVSDNSDYVYFERKPSV